jgi:hypothetical protein
MNSDTDILVDEILAKSGARTKCPICQNSMVLAEDADAEKMAYRMATNAWKDDERGFCGMEREEVMDMIKQALIRTPSKCPSCSFAPSNCRRGCSGYPSHDRPSIARVRGDGRR